jgi:hypothetical protein
MELIVSDTLRSQKLVATDSDYVLVGALPAAAYYIPESFRELQKFDPRLNVAAVAPIAFMGTLRRPDGSPRLVVIHGARVEIDRLGETMDARVLPLPGIATSRPAADYLWRFPVYTSDQERHVVEYRGIVIDPDDPSHLIVSYDLRKVVGPQFRRPLSDEAIATGTLDAFLQDDDSLVVVPRSDSPSGKVRAGQRIHVDASVKSLEVRRK